ncbi:MAG: hypothetical protein WCH34_09295 [Bacteroidota bacterium]
MKKVLTILFILIAISTYAQKVKYKEIQSLLKDNKQEEALTKLIQFYQQNLESDGLWKNNAILFQMDNMYDASKNIASIYYDKASKNNFSIYADTALYWYKIMQKDDHPEKWKAEIKINELKKHVKIEVLEARNLNIKDGTNTDKNTNIKQSNTQQINNLQNNSQLESKNETKISEQNSKEAISKSSINDSIKQDDKSNANKTVSVTVSGQGKTQDEAKQSALRNAIEQAFGAFISSKTEILNDALVKDEIVSVSNGNIQEYKVLSEVQMPDGTWSNTVLAKVSVSKLTTFCESKGINVEFKGGLFSINAKQQILNEENEVKAISNMCKVLKDISGQSFNFEIEVKDLISLNNDKNEWKIPITINIKINNNFTILTDYFVNTMKGISLSGIEAENYRKLEKPIYTVDFADLNGVKIKFNLRKKVSIMNVFDFLMYLKVSITNFSISNGIATLTGDQILCSPNETDNILNKLYKEDSDPQGHSKKATEFEKSSAYKYWDDTHVNSVSKIKDNFNPFMFQDKKFSLFNLHPCISNPYNGVFGGYEPCDEKIYGDFTRKIFEFSFSGIDLNKVLISLFFNDIRTLDELSKISQYKVNPIKK